MKIYSLLLSLIFCAPLALGQDVVDNQTIKRNTFTVSYAPFSLERLNKGKPTIMEGEYGFTVVGYKKSSYSGVFMLSYGYCITPKIELTLDLGYEQSGKNWKFYNNPLQITSKVEHTHYLHSLLNVSVIYFSERNMEMYSSFGLGAATNWSNAKQLDARIESTDETRFSSQFCLFGIRVKCADWWGFNCNFIAGETNFFNFGLFTRW